jgi:hypothetical protein
MIERSRSIPLPGLAAHRRLRGLTQRQLGELAGVATPPSSGWNPSREERIHRPYASLPLR